MLRDDPPYFGNCSFCDLLLKTQEEALAHCAPCKALHEKPLVETFDPVNQPRHYTQHPSGVECITVTEHMNFCIGNAMKYLWRADLKGGVEDLRKARWYIERELKRRKA